MTGASMAGFITCTGTGTTTGTTTGVPVAVEVQVVEVQVGAVFI